MAPEKDAGAIRRTMARVRLRLDERAEEPKAPRFAPAGQSTQMIVGADGADDRTILDTSAGLYAGYRLKRVYYSAYSPIPDASRALPPASPPLIREHRLYQADWLMRFYGFAVGEIAEEEGGMLPLDIDPKLAWALRHRGRFPIDPNLAPREVLLRVPGLGRKAVDRILASRRHRRIRGEDLARLRVPLSRAAPFLILPDRPDAGRLLDRLDLRGRLAPPVRQLELAL